MPSQVDLLIGDGVQAITRSPMSQEVTLEQDAGVRFTVRASVSSGESAESTRQGVSIIVLFWAGDFVREYVDGTKPLVPDEGQLIIVDGDVYRIRLIRDDSNISAIEAICQATGNRD